MAIRGPQGDSGEKKTEEERREEAIREGLSLMVGIFNASTEKADTRNWQTIPHDIYYSRVPLNTGENTVTLKTISSSRATSTQDFSFTAAKERNSFSFISIPGIQTLVLFYCHFWPGFHKLASCLNVKT